MFCSLAVFDPRVGCLLSPFIYLSLAVILVDSSTESSVHVLVLSIQAVRGLPRLRAPGIVPLSPLLPHGVTIVCQLPCFDGV